MIHEPHHSMSADELIKVILIITFLVQILLIELQLLIKACKKEYTTHAYSLQNDRHFCLREISFIFRTSPNSFKKSKLDKKKKQKIAASGVQMITLVKYHLPKVTLSLFKFWCLIPIQREGIYTHTLLPSSLPLLHTHSLSLFCLTSRTLVYSNTRIYHHCLHYFICKTRRLNVSLHFEN